MNISERPPIQRLLAANEEVADSFVANLLRRDYTRQLKPSDPAPGCFTVQHFPPRVLILFSESLEEWCRESLADLAALEEFGRLPVSARCSMPECDGLPISSRLTLCKRCRDRVHYLRRVARHLERILKEAA